MDMDRIMGVITLKAPTYRQIADDPNATTMAGIITVVAALIGGLGTSFAVQTPNGVQALPIVTGIIALILAAIVALIIWFVGAWVLAFVAKWFGGKTNTQEMLRVTGFVNIFSVIGVIGLLALVIPALGCILGLITFIIAILRLVGFVIGVREAGEFSTGNAIITAIIAVVIQVVIYLVIFGVVGGVLGLGAAALGAGQ